MNQIKNWVRVILVVLVSLIIGAGILATPLAGLYFLIAPLFGPDPVEHVSSVFLWIIGAGAVFGGLYAALLVATWAYEKSSHVRFAVRAVGYILVALVLISGISRCSGEGVDRECTPSRYVDC